MNISFYRADDASSAHCPVAAQRGGSSAAAGPRSAVRGQSRRSVLKFLQFAHALFDVVAAGFLAAFALLLGVSILAAVAILIWAASVA